MFRLLLFIIIKYIGFSYNLLRINLYTSSMQTKTEYCPSHELSFDQNY